MNDMCVRQSPMHPFINVLLAAYDDNTFWARYRLSSSYRLQLGTVGQSRTLVCAEVDAVDDEGAVVEIKSSPRVSADHQVQNMLCGVSTKIAAIEKLVRVRVRIGCDELSCGARSAF